MKLRKRLELPSPYIKKTATFGQNFKRDSYFTGPFLNELSIFLDIPSLVAVIDFENTAL
jgi:hypothetical protein